jgi:nitronate monooxygenase
MRAGGVSDDVPIIMAGGVWYLRDWNDWIDNPELGSHRLPVRHAPAAHPGKPDQRRSGSRLTTLEEGDVLLHRFSPTGFYSSAVRNDSCAA